MYSLNLNDYGKLISKFKSTTEYNGDHVFQYYNEFLNTKYTAGPIEVTFISESDAADECVYNKKDFILKRPKNIITGYDIDVCTTDKSTSEPIYFHLRTSELISLTKLKAFIDKSYEINFLKSNKADLTAITYNYNNAENKTESTYTVSLNIGKYDADIVLDKGTRFVLDGMFGYVYDSNNSLIVKYIILDNGYEETKILDNSIETTKFIVNEGQYTITENKVISKEFHDIVNTEYYISYDDKKYKINYKDGLFIGLSIGSNIIKYNSYKEDISEDNKLLITSSVHKFIDDDFDRDLSFLDKRLYCLDRIDNSDDVVVTREIYRIDEDKLEEFENIIKELCENRPDHPVL